MFIVSYVLSKVRKRLYRLYSMVGPDYGSQCEPSLSIGSNKSTHSSKLDITGEKSV